MTVEGHIIKTFTESGVALYWAEHMAEHGHGLESDIRAQLEALVVEGKLVARVSIHHADTSHHCWEGSPAEFAVLSEHERCPECNGVLKDEDEASSSTHYEISKPWRAQLTPPAAQ